MEKLEIIGKDNKSFNEDEFTSFLAEMVDKFFVGAPDGINGKTKFVVELTLAMFSAQITTELFKEE